MRATTIIDRLPEITPALLDITGLDTVQVLQFRRLELDEQGSERLSVATDNPDQLEVLSATYEFLHSLDRRSRLVDITGALLFSLGALVRVSDSASELSGRSKTKAGRVVKYAAPLAINAATELEFGPFDIAPYHLPQVRFSGVIAVRRSQLQSERHIARYAESYSMLLPFMGREQRKANDQLDPAA